MTAQLAGSTVLVFIGIPLLVVATVSLLVFAPSIASGPRYRPGLSWWAPPVWINGPSEREAIDAPELPAGSQGTEITPMTGGASASW